MDVPEETLRLTPDNAAIEILPKFQPFMRDEVVLEIISDLARELRTRYDKAGQ